MWTLETLASLVSNSLPRIITLEILPYLSTGHSKEIDVPTIHPDPS